MFDDPLKTQESSEVAELNNRHGLRRSSGPTERGDGGAPRRGAGVGGAGAAAEWATQAGGACHPSRTQHTQPCHHPRLTGDEMGTPGSKRSGCPRYSLAQRSPSGHSLVPVTWDGLMGS